MGQVCSQESRDLESDVTRGNFGQFSRGSKPELATRPQRLVERDKKLVSLAVQIQASPARDLTSQELESVNKLVEINQNFAASLQGTWDKHCEANDLELRLDDTRIDECKPEDLKPETRIKTIRQLAAEKQKLEKQMEEKAKRVSEQKKLIETKVAEQPPVDRAKLEKLKQSAEATAEMAKISQEIIHSMDLETEASKEMMAANQVCFQQSVQATTQLYKLAAEADINFQQLGGNKGTPFLSKCRAAGCTNPDFYAWYHVGQNRINNYDQHNAYYLMVYPDNTGGVQCTHCQLSIGIHPPEHWHYACDRHKDDYRPMAGY